ncbi:MAG: WG repeat-containing protein [Bacteroidales bacterium]|nr:WG repeat-containing protein [Bacteroidales bacterium]
MANERIFISYKRVNKDPVFALIARIEKELGVKCWVALDRIETSAQFASKICTAIDRADVVLFMHSSAHLGIDYENDWTVRELDYAHSENKHVVLVKLDDAPLKNIFKLIYGTRNNIDSRNPDQWNILLRDLRKWLNIEEPTKPQPEPPKPKPQPAPNQKPQPTPPPSKTPLQELEKRLARLDELMLMDFRDSNGKYGFKDKTGKVIIPCTWERTGRFYEGLADVQDSNGKWGFIDKTGKLVIPCKWESAWAFNEGLAKVKDSNGKWGYIDKTGNVIIPCTWEWTGWFSEGLAAVQDSNGKSGYIDKTDKVVIPCTWKDAWAFNEGLAKVKDSRGKWGFIDKTGKVIIPCTWDSAKSFINGKAKVQGKVGLFGNRYAWHTIDKTGKVIE